MRRAGKTTFLRQLLAERRRTLAAERALYLSFDDDRLAGLDAAQLGFLLEEHYRRHPELRGRGMETVIRPFSFREFLRHRGEEPAKEARRWTPGVRSLVEKRFLQFLVEGGFPEAQGLSAALRLDLLQGYVDTVLFRDVVERHGVTQTAALRWLVRQCLRNPGGSFSVHRLYHDLRAQGHGIGKDTVHALLGHLLDAFLVSAVPLASESERQRNSNPRKLYPADLGFVRVFDASGRTNLGHVLGTAVLTEVERRRADVGYVKTADGLEVDFLVRDAAGGTELVQVCADPSAEQTRTRELRALAAAAVAHPRARRKLLVLTHDQTPLFSEAGVDVRPAYEWLLARPGED